MEDGEMPRVQKYWESTLTWIMMAVVCHVTERIVRNFRLLDFLLNIVYLFINRKGVKQFVVIIDASRFSN
jgi:hypothetical protein